jgi:transposase-like protein
MYDNIKMMFDFLLQYQSVTRLADDMGVNRTTIYNWISKPWTMSIKNVRDLERLYDLRVDYNKAKRGWKQ